MLLLQLFTLILSINELKDSNERRDGSLKYLAKLLNNNPQLFQQWTNSKQDIIKFYSTIEPYLFSYIPISNDRITMDMTTKIDCTNPKYSNVLNGRRLSKPRVIIDIIPFGKQLWYIYIKVIYMSALYLIL